jgi:aminodeoxyfutalosine synthase
MTMQKTLLDTISHKVKLGQRLSDDDALQLFYHGDLVDLGALADQVNQQKNSDVVFFNVNRHINPTNICALSCKFCAYSRKIGEDGAYAYSIEEMVTKASEAVAQGATEVHMVGGLHPRWRFDHYKDMIRAVKTAHPSLHIKAFTAVELDWLARKARKSVREILEELKEAGLGSLPGGGAEIFAPEIRDQICETKVSAEQWLDTHRTAHRMGLHSNCTMLYGHIESYEHRVDHMRRLRELQDETGGFNAFIPLSFQPFQNEMGIDQYTFGYDDLKTLAIARLYLDNFKHVKAYWIMLGQDIAQLALSYGANDLDGTVIEEKISRMAGGRAGMAMSRRFIEDLILKSKHRPVERDTLYHAVGEPKEREDKSQKAPASPQELEDSYHRVRQALTVDNVAPSAEDLQRLAWQAPLYAVARLARLHLKKSSGQGSFAPTVRLKVSTDSRVLSTMETMEKTVDTCLSQYKILPQVTVLDLAPDLTSIVEARPEVASRLIELVTTIHRTYPAMDIQLAGFKTLWSLGQNTPMAFDVLLRHLADAGVTSVTSGPLESETDLTATEIQSLHLTAHKAGLSTVAKLELSGPTQGAGEPVWDTFIKRAQILNGLVTHGIDPTLTAVSVEVAPESFVTPTEFMRAIALARLAVPAVSTIMADLLRIPSLSQAKGMGAGKQYHGAEKIAALTLHYGATDLGSLDVEQVSPINVLKQIRASGFAPTFRPQKVSESITNMPENTGLLIDALRHIPSLA